MASSTLIPNPVINDSSKRRKRKKFQKQNTHNNNLMSNINNQEQQEVIPWKSEHQQQIYSSKLLQAIRHVRNGSGTSPNRGRVVRETADRVLAVTAKGRSRWSRAILTNKLKLKFMKNNRRQRGLVATSVTRNSRLKKPRVSILRLKTKNLPAVQRKARVLGGLVPGCRKQSLPVVLEEVTDYIPALEMQIKVMAALVELLSGGSSSGANVGADTRAGFLSQLGFDRPSPS